MDAELSNLINSPLALTLLIIIIFGSGIWKSYLGPMLASLFGFSLLEAMVMGLCSGLLSAKFSSLLSQYLFGLLRQIRIKPKDTKASAFNPKLRKLLRFWQRYGLPIAAFIAPTIIGIPTYSFIARRLQTNAHALYLWLSISIVFWVSASYYLGHYVIEAGLIDLSALIELLQSFTQ